MDYDVITIGGGPAGLAGALWLARYRHRVCLFDANNPRNARTRTVNGYLGLPSAPPERLREIGRAQALAAGAEVVEATVANVTGDVNDFSVTLLDGQSFTARRVLFATGLRDLIPEIPGLRECYGRSIWHCADCDGPGVTGYRVGVIGWGRKVAAFCMQMLTWTDRLTVLTHGRDPSLPPRSRAALERFGIPIHTAPIGKVLRANERVVGIEFQDGRTVSFDALFFHVGYGPGCSIPAALGCRADEAGFLQVNADFRTTIPGVYAAGDITRGSKLAIHAAADGTRAAIGIYRSLLPADRRV